FWLPTILKTVGVADLMDIGLLSALPSLAAIMTKIAVGYSSDRCRERRWHSALPAFVGTLALCLAARTTGNFMLSLVSISCAMAFISAAYSIFWSIPSDYLQGAAAAG